MTLAHTKLKTTKRLAIFEEINYLYKLGSAAEYVLLCGAIPMVCYYNNSSVSMEDHDCGEYTCPAVKEVIQH